MPPWSKSDRKRLRKQAADHIEAVQSILRAWDPIGVYPNIEGAPRDEYDSYAPRIVSLLHEGCTREKLAAHLQYIRVRWIGLPPSPEQDRQFADKLVSWWAALQ